MKKHPKAIAAFYGCVYGGNYYVPIDEEMPRFRIDLIFDNLKPKVMICDESTQEMAKTFDFDGELLIYDEVSKSPINEDALAEIRDKQLDTDPIYIVFTSGSTVLLLIILRIYLRYWNLMRIPVLQIRHRCILMPV